MERRKICFTYYWLADTPVYACPNCKSCNYSFQLREEKREHTVLRFYALVCNECEFQSHEIKRDIGTSYETVIIQAIWEWNLSIP